MFLLRFLFFIISSSYRFFHPRWFKNVRNKSFLLGFYNWNSERFKICSNSTRFDFFSLSSFYRFSGYNSLEMSEIKRKFIFGNFFHNRKIYNSFKLNFDLISLWFFFFVFFSIHYFLIHDGLKISEEIGLKIIVVGILYLASEGNLKFVQIQLDFFSLCSFHRFSHLQ